MIPWHVQEKTANNCFPPFFPVNLLFSFFYEIRLLTSLMFQKKVTFFKMSDYGWIRMWQNFVYELTKNHKNCTYFFEFITRFNRFSPL